MSADLAGARSAAGVVSIAQAVGQAMTVDATTATAEHVFGKVFTWDVLTTNLGRKELTDTGGVAPSAIWAPIETCRRPASTPSASSPTEASYG